mgnify:CR=1 FL=1
MENTFGKPVEVEVRDSLEKAQLKLQRERGSDLTVFSPRASTMAHHIGVEATSLEWTQINNDLIERVTTTPVGKCVRRTAEYVVLTLWPPGPLER